MKTVITYIFLLIATLASAHDTMDGFIPMPTTDSVPMTVADTATIKKEGGLKGWIKRLLNSKAKPSNKKFDTGWVVGPSYNAVNSFTLGGVFNGFYSWDRADSTLQKSNVSAYGSVSVTGMISVGVEGNNFLPKDNWRMNYNLGFMAMPQHFWGVGYSAGTDLNNYGSYTRIYVQFRPEILRRVCRGLYIGPIIDVNYTSVLNLKDRPDGTSPIEYHDDEYDIVLPKEVFTAGLGLTASLDTRDIVINATRGVLLRVQQLNYPSIFSNTSGYFGTADITFSHYVKMWKGCVMAYDLHGLFSFGDVPWTCYPQLGSSYRMRGYYPGQYRDQNLAELQLELRQHIWNRFGIAVWGGCGNVWGLEPFKWSHTLPNFGAGLRFELKQHSNVRIDFGFTNKDWNVCFNINEAF